VRFGGSPGSTSDSQAIFEPPIPAARHARLFPDVKVPRTANFNPKEPSGVNWIQQLPHQSRENIDYNDEFYRLRLRALQGVDELIDGVISRLEDYGIIDNTYIIYSSDNGYHIGQHRLQPGKECGFEEDINVPLIIRGPGVPKNATTDIVTTHTDLAPTILSLVDADLQPDFDGETIPTTEDAIHAATKERHEHVNVEFWGVALGEGKAWGRGTAYCLYDLHLLTSA
jgi:arylsulfatase A-like enzyme